MEPLSQALVGTWGAMGWAAGAVFVACFVRLVDLLRRRKRGEPWKQLMRGQGWNFAGASLVGLALVFAYQLGAANMRLTEVQTNARRVPLPAFVIGSPSTIEMSTIDPHEWRIVPWDGTGVLLDWESIPPDDDVAVDLSVAYGGDPLAADDPGMKLRLREADTDAVAGESDWIRPRENAVRPQIPLHRASSGRRYVLEGKTGRGTYGISARGVLVRR